MTTADDVATTMNPFKKSTPEAYGEPVNAFQFFYYTVRDRGLWTFLRRHVLPCFYRYEPDDDGHALGWSILGPGWKTRESGEVSEWRMFEVGKDDEGKLLIRGPHTG